MTTTKKSNNSIFEKKLAPKASKSGALRPGQKAGSKINFEFTSDEQCLNVSAMLKAIAHPNRLKVLCYLSEGEKTVSEIELYCGASQSSVSQYLNKMRLEGLVSPRRDGQHIYYSISNPKLGELLRSMAKIFK